MAQPNPWMLVIGGGALFQVGAMVGGARLPEPLRLAGVALCVVAGVTSVVLGVVAYVRQRRPPATAQRPRARSRGARPAWPGGPAPPGA